MRNLVKQNTSESSLRDLGHSINVTDLRSSPGLPPRMEKQRSKLAEKRKINNL